MRLLGEPPHGGASMTFHRRYSVLVWPARPRDGGMHLHLPGRWVERPLMGMGTREAAWGPNFRAGGTRR